MLENVFSHGYRKGIEVISGDELLKVASGHVFHHNTSLGLVGEVFFEAHNIRTAITTSPHLDLMTYKVFLPFLQAILFNYSHNKLFTS